MQDVERAARDLWRFISTPICLRIAAISSNAIFKVANGHIVIKDTIGLPADWLEWLQMADVDLKALASFEASSDMPNSLQDYLVKCRELPFDRTQSDVPAFSSKDLQGLDQTERRLEKRGVGLNAKKAHEVDRCTKLIATITSRSSELRVLDLGSGRGRSPPSPLLTSAGHLSRAMARPPLSAAVLAVDSSESQRDGAERLDQLSASTGSLSHRVQRLDQHSIQELILAESTAHPNSQHLVVGLHACGDLSVDTLRACVATGASLMLVPCCYNLMQTAPFPMSRTVAAFSPAPSLPRDSLMLATQCPAYWLSSTAAWQDAELALRKLSFRARLEAELSTSATSDARVGRLRDKAYADWPTYRAAALARLQAVDVPSIDLSDDEWTRLASAHAAIWTIRACLGPVIEALIVLDRHLYLLEALPYHKVELYPLFDGFGTGSLRNLAHVIRVAVCDKDDHALS